LLKLVGDFVAVAEYYFAYGGLEKISIGGTESKVQGFYQEYLSTRLFIV